MITLKFRFIEGGSQSRSYKTLAGAQRAAHRQIGERPSLGSSYAVDDYGCCVVRVEGCSLQELFPSAA